MSPASPPRPTTVAGNVPPNLAPDAQLQAARRFLLILGGTLALLALVLCAAVTLTDPNRYFFGSPVPQIWPNTPRLKTELFRAYSREQRVTGLFLGSSRCILRPQQADSLTGLRFFNAAVYSASTDHFLAIYRLFRKLQQAPPKMLVVGVDIPLLSSGATVSQDLIAYYPLISQLDSGLTLPWHYVKLYSYYFRAETFFDLKASLRNWLSPKPPLDVFLPDGHVEPRNPSADASNTQLQEAIQNVEPSLASYRSFQAVSPARLGQFRMLLAEASRDHCRLLLWLTPVHPALRAAIDRLPAVPAMERQARQRIYDLAAQYGAQVADLSDPASFGGDPSTWLDLVHVSAVDGEREANRLFATIRTDGK